MTDRILRVCAATSLALHGATALAAALVTAGTTPESRYEPRPVVLHLTGPRAPRATSRAAESPSPARATPPPRTARLRSEPGPSSSSPTPVARPFPETTTPRKHIVAAAARSSSRESAAADRVRSSASLDSAPDAGDDRGNHDEQADASPSDATGGMPEGLEEATHGDDVEQEERLSRYVATIRARIQDRKHYPALARKRSVEGRVVARIAIGVDGQIAAVELDGGSHQLLRTATAAAIRASAPYPAPPDGAITIELPIEYALRDAF